MTSRLGPGGSSPETCPFDYERDLAAVKRIWREVGWVDDQTVDALNDFFACGATLVARLNGAAECSVHTVRGSMRVQQTDLPLCPVTALTTSRVARGYGFARQLTAQQLRAGAEHGAALAALGMFDQGYYDQLGFGTGAYDHEFVIDAGNLNVDHRVPAPIRLTKDDFTRVHDAMRQRNKVNGSVVLERTQLMRAELGFLADGFGLGYEQAGKLTHFVWLTGEAERGPYHVRWLGYRTSEQLTQLLGLLKSLADQVYSVRLIEPPEVQLQSMLQRPFRNSAVSRRSKFANEHTSFAWWQARILDLQAVVSALRVAGPDVRFELDVSDPLADMLHDADDWNGIGGNYLVTLGDRSSVAATSAKDTGLPRLTCSVNALTRLLLAVMPASSLAVTDDFDAPDDLLVALDRAINWPSPHPGWDF